MTPVTRHAPGSAALLCTAVVCTALLAAACGKNTGNSGAPPSGSPSAAAPSAPASSSAAAPSASAASSSAGVAGCASSGLKIKVDTSQSGAAAGSTYVPIDFTNTTSSACTLFGYPGVSFVTGPSGSQIGRPATRNRAAAATLVTLAPGGEAHATIQVANAGNYSPSACAPVTAHWLKIFPPNQTAALYAPYTVQACSAKLPSKLGHQLLVFVVRPGAGKAGQAP
jgi:Domain of unknown function (DUF4232)